MFGDRDFLGKTVRQAFPELEGQGFYEWMDKVYATGERFVAERLPIRLDYPGAQSGQRYLDFIYEPVKRSQEHTSELQSLMRNSYAVFCLKKKTIAQRMI